MQKVYACLIGNWVCLNDDPECMMGIHLVSPNQWYEENTIIWSLIPRDEKDTYYLLDYVQIFYRNKHYRISPIFIQIVSE